MVDPDKAIYSVIRTGRVVLGSKRALNSLKMGKARMVVIASNAPKDLRNLVEYYSKVASIPVYTYGGASIELGRVCGKPFPVTMIAVRDPGDSDIMELVGGSSEE